MFKTDQSKTTMLIVLFVFVTILVTYSLSINNQLKQLKRSVIDLQYAYNDVLKQLSELIEMNSLILDSQYMVKHVLKDNTTLGDVSVELTSNKLGAYDHIEISYRTIFDFTKPENYDYTNEHWENIKMTNNKGNYSVDFIVPLSCDYELKIAYDDKGHINYESLPDLDLYSKAESVFMKDINIYSFKKNKLKFDVQISKFNTSEELKLLSAVCNIYYDNKIIESIDVLKENEVRGRKEPNDQLEHFDDNYWFIIDVIEFDNIDKLDESKILIEIVLEDSLKNTYKKTKGIY